MRGDKRISYLALAMCIVSVPLISLSPLRSLFDLTLLDRPDYLVIAVHVVIWAFLVRWAWRGPDGAEMAMHGVYREVVPPQRIVRTESFEIGCQAQAGEKKLEVLNAACPHANCFVDFVMKSKGFYCPCHNSAFAADGKISDPKSPSPRDLDSLEWEIRGKEVWVKFQNFRAGHKEKVAAT